MSGPLPSRLAACESVIRAGLANFVEVGNALLEIRDGKLYRETHSTFEAYCKERWSMARNYANKMIAASQVVASLGTTVPKPTSERQVRPLAHLPPEEQNRVWEKALEIGGGKPTAKDVEKAVVEVVPDDRSEFLSKQGVASAPPLVLEDEPEESKTLWGLKHHWRNARKTEKAAFLMWVRERGEMQN